MLWLLRISGMFLYRIRAIFLCTLDFLINCFNSFSQLVRLISLFRQSCCYGNQFNSSSTVLQPERFRQTIIKKKINDYKKLFAYLCHCIMICQSTLYTTTKCIVDTWYLVYITAVAQELTCNKNHHKRWPSIEIWMPGLSCFFLCINFIFVSVSFSKNEDESILMPSMMTWGVERATWTFESDFKR